jgi:hypothetical protein
MLRGLWTVTARSAGVTALIIGVSWFSALTGVHPDVGRSQGVVEEHGVIDLADVRKEPCRFLSARLKCTP